MLSPRSVILTIVKVAGAECPMEILAQSAYGAPGWRCVQLDVWASTSNCMMTTSGQKSLSTIGFLTIIRDAEHGLFGGYLVLNSVGRPLEFHCTAPVRPNRAQEILYGTTLEPYLFGERIGPTLLEKSKSCPVMVFTDVPAAMATRQFVATPMSLVVHGEAPNSEDSAAEPNLGSYQRRIDAAQGPPRPAHGQLHHFPLGPYQLAVNPDHPEDETTLASCWPEFADQIDLDEPFGRIREAIDEARRGGERARAA